MSKTYDIEHQYQLFRESLRKFLKNKGWVNLNHYKTHSRIVRRIYFALGDKPDKNVRNNAIKRIKRDAP